MHMRLQVIAASVFVLAVTTAGTVSARVTEPPHQIRHAGLGPIVRSGLGGQIFGWDINENGTDGFLAESTSTQKYQDVSAIETFDQTTGKITKIVSKQRSVNGHRELVAAAIEETLNGFSFSNVASAVLERVEVNGAQRLGYVNGPASNELQSCASAREAGARFRRPPATSSRTGVPSALVRTAGGYAPSFGARERVDHRFGASRRDLVEHAESEALLKNP
jgi:hypothetical protein